MAIREPSRTMRPLPIGERDAALGQFDADAVAAGVAQRDRAASWAAAVATMWTSSASSAAAITTMFGRQAR